MHYKILPVIIFIVIIAIAYAAYAFGINPFVHAKTTKDNAEAEAEANLARADIKKRKANGETGVIQISSCMQEPDGYKQAFHQPIPNTIFVSVASFRDDECKDTIADMYAKAKDPNNVYVGVCQQNKAGVYAWLAKY